MQLKAIVPKKLDMIKYHPVAVAAGLRSFAVDLTMRMGKYPISMGSYRRTGTLGRNWGYQYTSTWAIVANAVPYAGKVQGFKMRSPRQLRFMANRGWQSISDEARDAWKLHLPDIQRRLVRGGF